MKLVPGTGWTVTGTDDNTGGDGLVMPCQESRYADPRNLDALVRSFESAGKAPATATQSTEVSASIKAAGRGYDNAVDWFAGIFRTFWTIVLPMARPAVAVRVAPQMRTA